MKKLLGVLLFIFLSIHLSYAAVDRYPFTVTTDSYQFTTSVNKFWRWLETRVRFDSNTTARISHIFDSGDHILHDTVIDKAYPQATSDIAIYPGTTGDTAVVLFRNTDELKVVIEGTSAQPHVTIVGEEI